MAKSILTRRLSFTKPRSAITFSFDSLIPPPLYSPLSAVLPFVIRLSSVPRFVYYQRYIRFSAITAPLWLTQDEISRRDAWLACLAVVRVSRDCVLKLLDVLDAAMSIANLLTRVWLTTLLISRACTVFSRNVSLLVFRVRRGSCSCSSSSIVQWFFCAIGNDGSSFPPSIYF